MEQTTLIQMARLRTLAAKKGQPFDVVRFASDRVFAKVTLKVLLDTEDEELLVAGLQMMEALHMTVPEHPAKPAPATVLPAVKRTPPDTAKYVGRLR